jgi:hypothetical protein
MSISEPDKITTPWASTGSKNPIPANANNTTGAAGFDNGFPDITMTPEEAGGLPPAGQDFNGIFYEITKILQYMQAGGQPTFSAALATAIGGYPKGAMVLGSDGVAIYTNRVDGNSSNPNAGGSGWAREDLMLREALRRSYAEAGFRLVPGSFETGGVLVKINDVLLQESTGRAFSGPVGTILPGTSPLGGMFIDRSGDTMLCAYVEKYGAVGDDDGLGNGTDNTAAFQKALDDGIVTLKLVPGKQYKVGDLVVRTNGTTFDGCGFLYSGGRINYYGNSTFIKAEASVSYIQLVNGLVVLGSAFAPSTDVFRTGSVFLDQSNGSTSCKTFGCRIEGFETIFKGAYNSFYNTMEHCRVTKFHWAYRDFSSNNLNVLNSRFEVFHTLCRVNGGGGPVNISNCALEVFNGAICEFTGAEEGICNFHGNYVEIYDTTNLPTNFPATNGVGAKPGKFGGNILFTGPIAAFNSYDNELQIRGIFRFITTPSNMKSLRSKGNLIHLYATGNNLNQMWAVPSCESVEIADALGISEGDGGYTTTYTQAPISTPISDGVYSFWDCITGKRLRPSTSVALAMLNGWTSNDIDHGTARCDLLDGYTHLQGLVNGTSNTSAVICVIPVSTRPYVNSTTRSFANFTVGTQYGGGPTIRLRYVYETGELRCEGEIAASASITLDGVVIPPRV